MNKLKPCPFCSGEAEFESVGTARRSTVVVCTECGVQHESGDVGENAGASWNQRESKGRIEQLEKRNAEIENDIEVFGLSNSTLANENHKLIEKCKSLEEELNSVVAGLPSEKEIALRDIDCQIRTLNNLIRDRSVIVNQSVEIVEVVDIKSDIEKLEALRDGTAL